MDTAEEVLKHYPIPTYHGALLALPRKSTTCKTALKNRLKVRMVEVRILVNLHGLDRPQQILKILNLQIT